MLKAHLIGGDAQGWALDVDLRMTREALAGVAELVDSPAKADVIHSVNAEMLVHDPRMVAKLVPGRPVIAQFTSHPSRLFEDFPSLFDACQNWTCVAQSTEAFEALTQLRTKTVRQVPYVAELKSFFPISTTDPRLEALRRELQIPPGKYVVGTFVRDSLNKNLHARKPQKGADILLALLLGTAKRVGKERIHVLMAGPRRHWLRGQLAAHGISYSFDGAITEGDDNPQNILPLDRLNLLYNLVDLYVIPSRWEGAPAGLFHLIACRKKIISTDIAAPRDVLDEKARFRTLSEGIDLIVNDIRHDSLARFVDPNHAKVMARHTPDALRPFWREIYAGLERAGRENSAAKPSALEAPLADFNYSLQYKLLWRPRIALSRLRQRLSRPSGRTITIWGELVDGPYGGGSQALKAIAAELGRRGFRVLNNSAQEAHGHILNSAFFDVSLAKSTILSSSFKPRVVHRIDGPISLYRGKDRALDEAIFQLNREVATATAFQCHYSWEKSLDLGFRAASPMIIRNAVDPAFFFPATSRPPLDGRKLRILSSSWSTNAIKGFDVYQALDESLDFSRIEYKFVGRSPVKFRNIEMVTALPSRELGEELRGADVYITASEHDPASNSLTEALASGLPALFRRSGGHAEIAGFAGIPFREVSEVPALLEKLREDLAEYASCIFLKRVSDITDQYLDALGL